MTLRHCCFLTLEDPGDFVIDDEVAVPAVEASGWQVETLPWRQTARAWESFDLVVIRSTWDYWDDEQSFLGVLKDIAARTRLANPLPLVRWNLSKTYLRTLEERGVPVVPTLWCEGMREDHLAAAGRRFGDASLVVKPQVGGNGDGVFLLEVGAGGERAGRRRESRRARALASLADTPAMIQPFRPAVRDWGEASLFFLGGRYSHAVRKQPAEGEFRSQEERGARITPLAADAELVAAGERALAAVPGATLYARIDLLPATPGWEVVELELIEPSLYFRTDPGAPAAFARALNHWCPPRAG